jgi:hypothetical protein
VNKIIYCKKILDSPMHNKKERLPFFKREKGELKNGMIKEKKKKERKKEERITNCEKKIFIAEQLLVFHLLT